MPDIHGQLTPQGNLNGTLNTIVYASNYNVLENKPSINSVTLQGNKTASDLGLATPEDITVTSVNGETGAVVLDGSDINYDADTTLNNKIDDLQSQISSSGVLAVNGKTGVVILTGADINYSAGVTLNSKIDEVESEIPTVNYPVTSVNSKTGAVVLDGSDIAYDENNTVNEKIAAVESEIPTVDYPVTSVNEQTGDVSLTDNDISHYTGTPTAGTTAEAIDGKANKLTRKKYSVTLASNPYVPPFTYFYGLDITSDRATYGLPVGVWCDNAGVIAHIQNANRVDVSANSELTCDVYVLYCSNVNVIS